MVSPILPEQATTDPRGGIGPRELRLVQQLERHAFVILIGQINRYMLITRNYS